MGRHAATSTQSTRREPSVGQSSRPMARRLSTASVLASAEMTWSATNDHVPNASLRAYMSQNSDAWKG